MRPQVKGRDSQRCDVLRSPFPGISSLSRQLHDWQTYERPVNRCLGPSRTGEPPLASIGPNASATASRHAGSRLRRRQMKLVARLRSISGSHVTGSGLEWAGVARPCRQGGRCGPQRDDVVRLPLLPRRRRRSGLRKNWLVETTRFCLAIRGGTSEGSACGRTREGLQEDTRHHCFG
jgi:hypothetical protein